MQAHGPIFIGGLSNTGKTLLRLSLSSHPNVAMTRRTYMWTRFYGRFGPLVQPDNFERCLNALLQLKDVRVLEPDVDRIRNEFWHGEPTYGRLFALLHEQFAERIGKSRWGEQEGRIEHFAEQLFAAYPSAKVIHMIRDPRRRFEDTLLDSPPRMRPGQVAVETRRWVDSARQARRNREMYPAGYTVFRYEELISQPEGALRRICSFIEEDYSPAMITHEGAFRFGRPTGEITETAPGSRPGSRSSAKPPVLSPRELALLQSLAGREMAAWDYAPEPVRLSPAERMLYYAFDWPCGVVRMTTAARPGTDI